MLYEIVSQIYRISFNSFVGIGASTQTTILEFDKFTGELIQVREAGFQLAVGLVTFTINRLQTITERV